MLKTLIIAQAMEKLHYQIGITKIKGIGPSAAKSLIAYLGGVEPIFEESEQHLRQIPGIDNKAEAILYYRQSALKSADAEINYLQKHNIRASFYTDESYPLRLKECNDFPLILYARGNAKLNPAKSISIVGTRRSTPYGTEMTKRLVEEISEHYPGTQIVSGLAYGVDIVAHRAALRFGLPTVGVLAHGLDHIYPGAHRDTAQRMIEQGALLTEFPIETTPIRENFVRRNRIVAGMTDATIVIESAKRGGSLITANMASGYNREVFAVPGRKTDELSEGCNKLIKNNQAVMVEELSDIEYVLGWSRDENKKRSQQTKLMLILNDEEQLVYDYLQKEGKSHINPISIVNKLPMSKLNPILINMEFNGLIKCFPGNMYEIA